MKKNRKFFHYSPEPGKETQTQYSSGSLIGIRQEKEIKSIQIEREELK